MLSLDEFEIQQTKDLGEFVAQLRYKTGMTQRELGQAAQVGQAAITAFEKAQRDFKFQTFQTVLRALGYRLDISVVPIDGGDPIKARPDPNMRKTRTYGGNTFKLKGPRRMRNLPAHKPIEKVPDVEYEFEGEFDTKKEVEALRKRLLG